MADLRRAVELGRTLRGQAGIKVRQPLAQLWLALPGGRLGGGHRRRPTRRRCWTLLADELNVRTVTLIGDGSDLVERRVKPLLPVLGQRGKGAIIPAVMAAARADEVEYLPDGGVRLGGHELAADEVEILATPRPGTAVAARRRHRGGHRHHAHRRAARGGRRARAHPRPPGPAPPGGAGARCAHRGLAGRGRPSSARLAPHLDGVAADVLADVDPGGAATAADAASRTCARRRDGAHRPARRPPAAGDGRDDRGAPSATSRIAAPVARVRGHRACVVVLDQASKAWVESSFALARRGAAPGSPGAPTPVLGDLVRIARSDNDGGIFGCWATPRRSWASPASRSSRSSSGSRRARASTARC